MEDLQFQLDMMRALNQQLDGKEKMYQLVFSTSKNAFIYIDFVLKSVQTLGHFNDFFDFSVNTLDDMKKFTDIIEENRKEDFRKILRLEETGEENLRREFFLPDNKRWVEFDATVMYDREKPVKKIIRIQDITKEKAQNEELRYMAYYDMLTGLYNRNYFASVLGEWLRSAAETKQTIAVLCVDIDNFKKINDGLGLVAGDEMIQQFGLFLKEFMDDQTIVAHVTDDTYYIAVRNAVGSHAPMEYFNKIQRRLQKPFKLVDGQEIFITVCVGVAEYPEAASNALELINCSEIVLFKAKSRGPNSIEHFETPIFEDFIHQVQVENKLKDAINLNQFVLYYQPQYDAKSKKMRGVEALIRWKDSETGKLISPGMFIPIAEESGMIEPIGTWVLEEGIRVYAKWRETYNFDMVLSLNISAIQYRHPDFVQRLLDILEKYNVNPKDIELEITESVLIDDFEGVIKKLQTLKEYGIKISLDDFGTGFSSLSYLKELPIDTLKIDKSFVDTVIQDQSAQVIMESIISMGKRLGYETVAEGVETSEQFEYLKNIDCDNIQGYLLGKPMPGDQIEVLLDSGVAGK
ncbi:MAG: bifunctional diguanylate cyclase/phosphodiesterase [Lachnospiraceae bacterium]|nr:bifunctional diguanylate cyclase/phosphodiesterase [Lachnospiraceae bacterium]